MGFGLIFGDGERGDNSTCFMGLVHHRTSQTLMPISQKFITPRTTIISHNWIAYISIESGDSHNDNIRTQNMENI
ncbi:hypothetical protein HZS_2528 [Henneguya salminicola]|nr:hypothetical protein HZS_2528 [Henneguya salminicola]